jgi:hypothetical protein
VSHRTGDRLDSWKEIADYVRRDVRTAIRWEDERGLPVHRVPGGKRGTVFAFTEEIDRWLAGTQRRSVGRGAGDESTAPCPPPQGNSIAASSGIPSRTVWMALLAGGLPLFALGLALQADVWPGHGREAAAIGTIQFADTVLVALGPTREVLWRHDFGRPVFDREDSQIGQAPTIFTADDDLDGDGRPDLVVNVPFASGTTPPAPERNELFAFSAQGRVMWSHRLDESVTFGSGTYDPPWHSPGGPPSLVRPQVAVFEVDGRKRIAWAQVHHTWWPSILSVLDAAGRPVSRWVHSGGIYVVTVGRTSTGPRLLVGGVSNSHEAAFFAVLDPRHVEGAGPEEPGSPFECLSCPPGRPLRYFTVQPSELILASGPYNSVFDVQPYEDAVEVRTRESASDSVFAVQGILRFSLDFMLEHAGWSSAWAARHRELEGLGRLGHSVEACSERARPPRVREWTPESGWRNLLPADVRLAVARNNAIRRSH